MSFSLQEIQAGLPVGGLYEGGWRFSPEPLRISRSEAKFLGGLGHLLSRLQQSMDEIYRQSASGLQPAWIAELLDAGKPAWMVEAQRAKALKGVIPRIIRPDLLLGEQGFSLTELDSVPGGLGITAWLAQFYSQAGIEVLGGERGVVDGFSKILDPGGAVLISEESGDYRKEMQWLIERAGENRELVSAEDYDGRARSLYRFFEWFDWEAIPYARHLAEDTAEGKLTITPPCKPHLEDKLWLALLWTPALRPLWKQMLRGSHLERIREVVPFGWIVDPAPLPPQAALPKLEVNAWSEVADLSQRERKLVLKISGFHETAWGSKGVFIGHDLPKDEWSRRLKHALDEFDQQPWMMQEFKDSRLVEHPVFMEDGSVEMMSGRARICPYYFTDQAGRTELGGCLATIVPADKKKIHGMKDGVLVPVAIDAS